MLQSVAEDGLLTAEEEACAEDGRGPSTVT
jgi:hypothetical protein